MYWWVQLVKDILMLGSTSIAEKATGTTKQYSDMVYRRFFMALTLEA